MVTGQVLQFAERLQQPKESNMLPLVAGLDGCNKGAALSLPGYKSFNLYYSLFTAFHVPRNIINNSQKLSKEVFVDSFFVFLF